MITLQLTEQDQAMMLRLFSAALAAIGHEGAEPVAHFKYKMAEAQKAAQEAAKPAPDNVVKMDAAE